MKLNNLRIFVFLLLLAVVVAVGVIFLKQEKEAVNQQPESTASTASPAPAVTGGQAIDSTYEKIKTERERKLQQFFNTPIDFYGKVVDENNKPIGEASTYYIAASASFSGSPTLEGPKTNTNGLFSITKKRGPDFSVWVEHPDYHRTESASQQFEYARRDYMPGKEPPLPPTKDNPAIFILKKKGVTEPLIYHRRIKAKLPMNGTTVAVNIRSGQTGEENSDSVTFIMKSEGDKLPLNKFYPFDWSVTIGVPNGGLIERSDALNFQAPADGYSPQVTINMPTSLPEGQWNSDIQRDYFVKFGSGTYGRVELRISGDKGRCIAETFLNPKLGSRNLEFNPTKQVKP